MTDRDTHDEWRSQNDVKAVLDDDPDDVVFYSAEEIARFKADGWRRVGEGWAKP